MSAKYVSISTFNPENADSSSAYAEENAANS
jgi:hypothetical protein